MNIREGVARRLMELRSTAIRCYMPRKKAGKTGGWGSEIKGWDTYKGGIDFKGGGDHTPLHTM